ncbi:MAG: hypothetical protein EBT84_04650 [Sphingomonadaceae bacterium]|nr:hypothetical protein [Sphingomonadaceae bacterium]
MRHPLDMRLRLNYLRQVRIGMACHMSQRYPVHFGLAIAFRMVQFGLILCAKHAIRRKAVDRI